MIIIFIETIIIGEKVLPSVYMPPLYYYFIYSLKFISLPFLTTGNLVIIFQLIFSAVSIFLFFRILNEFVDKKFSLILTSIFTLFPINILAAAKISSM